jgi:hypothetical protein
MKTNIKAGALITAAGALAIAVPAAAHPGPSSHPGSGNHPSGTSHPSSSRHPSRSHWCQAHNRAYVEAGTVDATTASTLAENGDGTWSGTLVVDVTMANHAARADTQQTVTYTFTNAKLKVRFDNGASGFASGERVKLIGKQAAVAKKCIALSPAPAPMFRMLVVEPAAA